MSAAIIAACTSLAGCELVDTVAPFLVPNRAPVALGEIPPAYRNWRYAPSPDVAVWPYFDDPDGDALTFTATPGDPEILRVRVVDGFVEVRALRWRTAAVTVTATDPSGLTAQHRFDSGETGSLPGFVPPGYPVPPRSTVAIPSLQVLRGQRAVVHLGAHFKAYPFEPTFEAISSSPGSVEVSVSGDTLAIDGVDLGSALVTVSVSTEAGLATQEFKVVVDPPTARLNSAPVFQGFSSRKVIPQGIGFSLDVSPYFLDPEEDPLAYAAKQGGPVLIVRFSGDIPAPIGEAAVSVASASRIDVRGTRTGFARITITATDPGGLPVHGDLIVEVTPPVRR
ncbi:MAG: hypothetical protein F4Y74_13140 [Gemmatimonadales bacterium]|nr:hypothetical protein [Gemmatimonadales bacterium]MYG18975.1 hypothetical protein [Gemmatimonadales bacterium]